MFHSKLYSVVCLLHLQVQEFNAGKRCGPGQYTLSIELSKSTLLKKSVEMAVQIGLDDTVVVLDQAIYAKALEVV